MNSLGLLSTEPAGKRDRRRAGIAVVVSLGLFLAIVPFAGTPLHQIPSFIPLYVSALIVCDLITAALLFGQYRFVQAPELLALAGGYLFTASATVGYALIFPSLFSPAGLLGAGPQTSSAMYMFWHGGFPFFVLAYAQIKARRGATRLSDGPEPFSPQIAIACTVAGVVLLVAGFTSFSTLGQEFLPTFLNGDQTTTTGRICLLGVWLLSLGALVSVGKARPYTVLDVWVFMVMCVWLFDIALAALLNTGRYDLGWYVGRIYGLLAASFLLIALLMEDLRQYARLFQLSVELGQANLALEKLSRQDGLTELANRRHFDAYLTEQISIARRFKRPLSLLLCDVDHFKSFNDHYGHQKGDECLKRVATTLKSCCHRPADLVARFGGEEFVFVFPDTDLKGAMQIAEEVRTSVIQLQIPHARSSTSSHVSISSGVADFTIPMNAAELISAADKLLYQAKGLGRNKVVGMYMEY